MIDQIRSLKHQVETLQAEVEHLRKFEKIVTHTWAERLAKAGRTDIYFICGEGGEKDRNGLPELVMICPSMGCDFSVAYKRVEQKNG